jgi:transcriptional regulator with XRE-family HTH domain
MKERIRTLMTNAGLTQQDFALRLEISAASLSNIFNGKTNPTNTHVCAVHKAFPNVNINWLLFGEGEMFLDDVPGGSLSESGLLETDANLLSMATADSQMTFAPTMNAQSAVASPMQKNVPQKQGYSQFVTAGETNFIEKKCDKPLRKVKEIRVFYDDGTYESFIPTVK